MKFPVIVEQQLPCNSKELQPYLFEKKHLTGWFFDNIPAFEAREGFETSFPVQSESRTFTHQWTILSVSEQALKIRWRYKEYPGDSYVLFHWKTQGEGCLLTVEAHITEPFPENIPEFKAESCHGGWTYFMDRLNQYIQSR